MTFHELRPLCRQRADGTCLKVQQVMHAWCFLVRGCKWRASVCTRKPSH
jgi:hypothetical protein